MKKICLVLLLTTGFVQVLNAQQADSTCGLRISVITCTPGDDLYSLFGHTALRIVDSVRNTDIVYNWGTFDFDTPNFYLKFMQGKLLYFVSTDTPEEFLYIYNLEGRGVFEQPLNLSCSEKMQILNTVNYYMQGNNRFYKYDFLFDNCTTRIRDIIFKNNRNVNFSDNIVPPETSFREMIHYYLDRGNQPWSKLGIDILLGVKTDRAATNREAMFLPEFFMKGLNLADKNFKPLVPATVTVINGEEKEPGQNIYVPLILITIFCTALYIISILKANWAQHFTVVADSFLLYITGLIGAVILFMWFGTEHIVCSNNFNLAWALPTNFIAAFFVSRKPSWLKIYFIIATILTGIMLIAFYWLPQDMNVALVPLLLLLLNRYLKMAFNSTKKI